MKAVLIFAGVFLVLLTLLKLKAAHKAHGAPARSPGRGSGGPSLRRILKRDPLLRITTWSLAGIWALYSAWVFAGLPKLRMFSIVLAAVSAIEFPVLISKIRFYRGLFGRGMEVAGRVTRISISDAPWSFMSPDDVSEESMKCRVDYSYSFRDGAYHGKGVVRGTKTPGLGYFDMMDSPSLQPGDEIALLVDPEKPDRSIMRDLYASGAETLLRKPVDKPESVFPGGKVPRDEKSAEEAITALETGGKGKISTVQAVSGGLLLALLSGLFFYMYLSYEPLAPDQLTEFTGHVNDWRAGRGDEADLRITTREHPYLFVVPDNLFKPGSYFDYARFQNEVKAGDELVLTIRKEDLQKTGEKRNLYALSSKDHVYLSIESAAAYDRKNHRWNLYVALGFLVLTIAVTGFALAGILTDKKGTIRVNR